MVGRRRGLPRRTTHRGRTVRVRNSVNVVGGADQSWLVSVNGGAFANAFVVTSPPGALVVPNTPGSYQWISASPSASTGVNPSNFVYRQTFNLPGLVPGSAVLGFRCSVDNNFFGYSLNGGATVTGACPSFSSGFGSGQTVTTGFVSGVNTIDFFVQGDGTTDGFVLDVTAARAVLNSTAPEPASIALTATGLLAIAAFVRRRRA